MFGSGSSRRRRRRWSVAAFAVAAAVGLVSGQGVARAGDPTPIAVKYAALGGATGPLGAASGAEDCTLADAGCAQEYDNGQIVWSRATGAHALTSPDVFAEWVDWGAESGDLGYPTSDTFCGLGGGGCGQHFTGGSIYWSPATGAAAVYDEAQDAWAASGWEFGPLGYPTDDQQCGLDGGGCLQYFQHGTVYLSDAGAYAVSGSILDRWGAQGWENGDLGYPTSVMFCGLRGGGCGQHFQGGSIYRGPAGTFAVSGRIEQRWAAQGWEVGGLGYPTSDQFGAVDATGQHFQGGSVYDTAHDGVVLVPVPLRDVWGAAGWERGLGYPTSGAFCGLRDGGCGQHFHNGSVYSSPAGTFFLPTTIEQVWGAQGWESGTLGYPTSNPFPTVNGNPSGQHFQGGSVYGGYAVSGPIRDKWAAQGWERGALGYPSSPMFCGLKDGGCGQHFGGGSIYVTPTGTFTVLGTLSSVRRSTGIRSAWAKQGWETGALGYPTGDAFCGLKDGGCGQHFQAGSIYTQAGGAVPEVVPPAIERVWAASGWENGPYGYPIGSVDTFSGGIRQPFMHGTITVR